MTKRRKCYKVIVKSLGDAVPLTTIGTVIIESTDRAEAEKVALTTLRDMRLAALGMRAETHAERISGHVG